MTGPGREADSGTVGRTLCDIAQVLESGEGAQARIRRALDLLGKLVPYEQCALLEAELGADPRLIAVPGLAAEQRNGLQIALVKLFGQLLEERGLAPETPQLAWGPHLAVPLVGLDEVIGVLFVRREQNMYEKQHLRSLSLVAAQLAAYLMMLRGRAEEMGRARELQEARRAAEFALRAREQLVELIGQELKTPQAAGLAWVRLLASGSLGRAERRRALAVIERLVRARDCLVTDLVALSSAEGLRLELGKVELAVSLADAVEVPRPLAEQRSIKLEAEIDGAAGPVVADAARIEAAVAVLLANALSLTPDGGRVCARLEHGGIGARIRVTNSGKGFDAARLPHLFDGLGRQQRPAIPGQGGLGLGLAMVKHVIELHGGNVYADSKGEDEGATFTFELPLPEPATEAK